MNTLELRSVVKRYTTGGDIINAADDVSLTIDAGQFVALYGPSGSGKSTLLMMAAALSQPDSGSIMFDGRDVCRLSGRDNALYRAKDVGIVFQSCHLLPKTSALDNATLKLGPLGLTPKEAREMAKPWLIRLGLGARLHHGPAELSMGERQRVVIARALTSKPRLVLADEPTGHLDSKRGAEVMGLFAAVCKEEGIPILLVTHDPKATSFVDRAYTLRDGMLTSLNLSAATPIAPSVPT